MMDSTRVRLQGRRSEARQYRFSFSAEMTFLHDSSFHQTFVTHNPSSCQASFCRSSSFFQESLTLNSGNITYSLCPCHPKEVVASYYCHFLLLSASPMYVFISSTSLSFLIAFVFLFWISVHEFSLPDYTQLIKGPYMPH